MPNMRRPPGWLSNGDPDWEGTTVAQRRQAQMTYDLLAAQEEANRLERVKILREQELEEQQRRNEEDKIFSESCIKVGLNYDFLKEFRNIVWNISSFDWDTYCKIDATQGNEILKSLDCYSLSDIILSKFKIKRSYYNMLKFFSMLSGVGFVIMLAASIFSLALAIFIIFIALIFGTFFTRKSYIKALKDIDKIRQLFADYVETGKVAVKEFNKYRKENYSEIFDSIITQTTLLDSIATQKKMTRTEKLKNNEISQEVNKINNGLGEQYNYKMADILDKYDQEIRKMVENFKNNDMLNQTINNEENTEYCSKCGNKIEMGEKFCGKCGNKI